MPGKAAGQGVHPVSLTSTPPLIPPPLPLSLSLPPSLPLPLPLPPPPPPPPQLQTGLDVNVKFDSVRGFELTSEIVIFDLLNVPLYHGWLPDPQVRACTAAHCSGGRGGRGLEHWSRGTVAWVQILPGAAHYFLKKRDGELSQFVVVCCLASCTSYCMS